MGGIPGLDLSDPKQLADFARYDLSGTRFDNDYHDVDEGDGDDGTRFDNDHHNEDEGDGDDDDDGDPTQLKDLK